MLVYNTHFHFIKSNPSFDQKASYASLSEKKEIRENHRDPRHYAPANKEWKNSVYAYNKSYLLNIAAKDKKVAAVIKSYFNLVPRPVRITKSKRMRDLLRRSSTRQLFVSKPEIKQKSDKAVITVYTHDREKVLYLKKLFMLNRWLNSNVLGLDYLKEERHLSDGFLINKYSMDYLFSERIFNKFRSITYRRKHKILKRRFSKFFLKYKFFEVASMSLLNKKQFVVNTIFYHFLRWILSLFNIKVNIEANVATIVKKNKISKKNDVQQIDVMDLIMIRLEKGKKKSKTRIIEKKTFRVTGVFNMTTLKKLNVLLLQYLIININRFQIKQISKIHALFSFFRKKYFNAVARKHLKKEILVVKYLTKLNLNKFKYYYYLPGLKNILTNIYDKKIELNIVNLKYLHLNSDLFTEAMSIKLRKRTTGLLRVLRKSFKLIKTFKPDNMFLLSEKKKNFFVKDIKTYFGKYTVINGNVLNVVFKEMFKNKISRDNTTIKNTLTSLKYKWITGVRVEAAGRLTKRYAAARALFKYKYRGTLKNLEHLKNVENKLQSPSLFLLRGDARPNTQYTFLPSKRRIGAFGLKSWISSS